MAFSIGSNSFSPPPAAEAPSWSLGWVEEEAPVSTLTPEQKKAQAEAFYIEAFNVCMINLPQFSTAGTIASLSCVNQLLSSKMPGLVSGFSLKTLMDVCNFDVIKIHCEGCEETPKIDRFKTIIASNALGDLARKNAGTVLLSKCAHYNNNFDLWEDLAVKNSCSIHFESKTVRKGIARFIQDEASDSVAVLLTANAVEYKVDWETLDTPLLTKMKGEDYAKRVAVLSKIGGRPHVAKFLELLALHIFQPVSLDHTTDSFISCGKKIESRVGILKSGNEANGYTIEVWGRRSKKDTDFIWARRDVSKT
jgi:hypothetical protein